MRLWRGMAFGDAAIPFAIEAGAGERLSQLPVAEPRGTYTRGNVSGEEVLKYRVLFVPGKTISWPMAQKEIPAPPTEPDELHRKPPDGTPRHQIGMVLSVDVSTVRVIGERSVLLTLAVSTGRLDIAARPQTLKWNLDGMEFAWTTKLVETLTVDDRPVLYAAWPIDLDTATLILNADRVRLSVDGISIPSAGVRELLRDGIAAALGPEPPAEPGTL